MAENIRVPLPDDQRPVVETQAGASAQAALRRVKVVHTIAWAFFAGCILALPVAAWRGDFDTALVLIAIVFVEVGVLLVNGWRCPLTGVAARYTGDRRDNFDIYLPPWLARHNKLIFGALFAAELLFTLARWMSRAG
ncbi:MAG TPA: hypothetical protein VEX86_02945 [Longimicrobium sp.]|nr:hypothetical protein [Longimicrobium sp.]